MVQLVGWRSPKQRGGLEQTFDLVPQDRSIERAIGERITITPSECWAYNGVLDRQTVIRPGLRTHRYIYETLVRPLPKGARLIPTCGNKGCCNPQHRRLD